LAAHAMRVVEPRMIGIDDDLHHARGIANVEEHDTAVVSTVCDPAAHDDRAPHVLGAQITRSVRAHHQTDPSFLIRNRAATSARGTSRCSPLTRSFTATTPSASSRGPSITPQRAPTRSAAPHCFFAERLPYARSADRPSARSSLKSVTPAIPPT